MNVSAATIDDVSAIVEILRANRDDPSLFQQPRWEVERHLAEFLVARKDDGGAPVGCIQVHRHPSGQVEILAVAVHPDAQGTGVGGALVRRAVARARQLTHETVFLGTLKPSYFGRFGFEVFERSQLPLLLLARKLPKVFRQPAPRWLPALFGRPVFMTLPRA